MSSKKDNFTSQDKKFMQLALKLASVRKGLTGENPSVGCLIVKNDQIISIGQTGFNGRPHACLLYTSPSPRDREKSRMPSSA